MRAVCKHCKKWLVNRGKKGGKKKKKAGEKKKDKGNKRKKEKEIYKGKRPKKIAILIKYVQNNLDIGM